MRANPRREEIAETILREGQARIDDLASRFNVSRMTIHRHVDALAREGVLRKLHGLVTVQPSGLYESVFRYRTTVAQAEKQALARAALAEIEPGQAVMLDDSSTVHALAALLPERAPLTVVTNSMAAANRLAGIDGIDLVCLGGRYHPTYQAFIGPLCEQAVRRLKANVLVCSASAVSGTTCFVQDGEVTRGKQAMMEAAVRRILLVDHGKFGKVALNVLADLADFDRVLVSEGVGADEIRALQDGGVDYRIVRTA